MLTRELSSPSRFVAGLALVLVPTTTYGGSAILQMVLGRIPGYHENPLRKAFFRAGHAGAGAGVVVLLTLVSLLLVDGAALPDTLKALVRWSLFATPLLISAGFFLSVLLVKAERSGPPIGLRYLGIDALSIGTLTLGVGLLRGL